jgi:uncharacterized tellurite resistance protein B-like protein
MAMFFQEILDQFKRGKATAKSQIKNLIEMACADGRYSEEENDLLISIASRNGISITRINEIRTSQTKIPIGVPKTEADKFGQIYDLVRMMFADRNIHPEEVRVSELFASHFGYPKTAIKGMVETIQQNILHGNDVHDTYERVVYFLKVNQLRMSYSKAKA